MPPTANANPYQVRIKKALTKTGLKNWLKSKPADYQIDLKSAQERYHRYERCNSCVVAAYLIEKAGLPEDFNFRVLQRRVEGYDDHGDVAFMVDVPQEITNVIVQYDNNVSYSRPYTVREFLALLLSKHVAL